MKSKEHYYKENSKKNRLKQNFCYTIGNFTQKQIREIYIENS